jgi:hypothetical protein
VAETDIRHAPKGTGSDWHIPPAGRLGESARKWWLSEDVPPLRAEWLPLHSRPVRTPSSGRRLDSAREAIMHYDPTQAILSVEQPGEVSATVVCVKFGKLVMVGAVVH